MHWLTFNMGCDNFEARLAKDWGGPPPTIGGVYTGPDKLSDVFADDFDDFLDEARSVADFRREAGLLP